MFTLYCEICQQPIAEFDPDAVSIPMTEDMFRSDNHARGAVNPFLGQRTWDLFLCPLCRHSPFAIPDTGQVHPERLFVGVDVSGQRVYYNFEKESDAAKLGITELPKKYECQVCGFKTSTPGGMGAHMRVHKEKRNADN